MLIQVSRRPLSPTGTSVESPPAPGPAAFKITELQPSSTQPCHQARAGSQGQPGGVGGSSGQCPTAWLESSSLVGWVGLSVDVGLTCLVILMF
jgi:hypothetical protein